MTQAETFIILQTLWDFFLIVLACGISCYWIVFWLLVFNDVPLNPERNDMFAKLILRLRELKNSKSR